MSDHHLSNAVADQVAMMECLVNCTQSRAKIFSLIHSLVQNGNAVIRGNFTKPSEPKRSENRSPSRTATKINARFIGIQANIEYRLSNSAREIRFDMQAREDIVESSQPCLVKSSIF